MQAAWLLCAVALVAHSRADLEAVQPMRCFACGGDRDACAGEARTGAEATGFAGLAVLCPANQPYCATRAISPNFTSVLSCSAAVEGVCSLNYSIKGTYEMICVCSSPLCNAPFSNQMQTELINYTTFSSATNSTQLNEMFWKLSHLANDSDANIYNKITEKRSVTEAPPRLEGSEWQTMPTIAASPVTPGGNAQKYVMSKEIIGSAEPSHQVEATQHMVQKVVETRSQDLRQVNAQIAVSDQRAEEPRVQAVRQLPPTVAPSDDDDEDEGEGSGAEEESPGRRAPPAAPAAGAAAPNSYLPADENGASPLFFNLVLISSLFLYNIV